MFVMTLSALAVCACCMIPVIEAQIASLVCIILLRGQFSAGVMVWFAELLRRSGPGCNIHVLGSEHSPRPLAGSRKPCSAASSACSTSSWLPLRTRKSVSRQLVQPHRPHGS